MGILRADLALYRLPSEPSIDAEINEIKDLCRCYRGWKNFFGVWNFPREGSAES